MNARIFEFAKQAGAFLPGIMGLDAGHPAVGFQCMETFEKFAELIVKECITVVENTQLDKFAKQENPTDFVEGWEVGNEVIIENLMLHFGVEE